MPTESSVIVVLGPTATGKSALGMRLARHLDGEIVNADALQVYRGFDLGTAKPTAEDQAEIPHHLVDILDPDERYSAGEFAQRAREAIDDIRSRGRRPIVVGGSGLYLRALLEGISPVPPGDPEVRAALRERVETDGLPALYAELERRDPATAANLPPGDTQRILRALEVVEVSGTPLSEHVARRPYGEERLPAHPCRIDASAKAPVRSHLWTGGPDDPARLGRRGRSPARTGALSRTLTLSRPSGIESSRATFGGTAASTRRWRRRSGRRAAMRSGR